MSWGRIIIRNMHWDKRVRHSIWECGINFKMILSIRNYMEENESQDTFCYLFLYLSSQMFIFTLQSLLTFYLLRWQTNILKDILKVIDFLTFTCASSQSYLMYIYSCLHRKRNESLLKELSYHFNPHLFLIFLLM